MIILPAPSCCLIDAKRHSGLETKFTHVTIANVTQSDPEAFVWAQTVQLECVDLSLIAFKSLTVDCKVNRPPSHVYINCEANLMQTFEVLQKRKSELGVFQQPVGVNKVGCKVQFGQKVAVQVMLHMAVIQQTQKVADRKLNTVAICEM